MDDPRLAAFVADRGLGDDKVVVLVALEFGEAHLRLLGDELDAGETFGTAVAKAQLMGDAPLHGPTLDAIEEPPAFAPAPTPIKVCGTNIDTGKQETVDVFPARRYIGAKADRRRHEARRRPAAALRTARSRAARGGKTCHVRSRRGSTASRSPGGGDSDPGGDSPRPPRRSHHADVGHDRRGRR